MATHGTKNAQQPAIVWTNSTRRLSHLVPWEHNPKVLTETQAQHLTVSLDRFGLAYPLLIGPSDEILDGHQRSALLANMHRYGPDAVIDVRVSSRPLTDDERRELVVRLRENVADWDYDALASLYQPAELVEWGLSAWEPEEFAWGADGELQADDEGGDDDDAEPAIEVPDAIFPTDNDFGIPLLDANLQATAVVAPVQPWGAGAGARSRQNRGTWHFYTEDYRFDALWRDPSPVVKSGCTAVVEPNFSVYLEMPRVVALWHVYRKRWLARWWQAHGVRVFVDLNVAEPHYADNLLGVPQGWKAWATRGYAERLENTLAEYDLACQHAGTSDILFLVYGGGRAVKELCTRRGWVHMIEQRDAAKVKV